MRAFITKVADLCAVASALESNLGEAWPALALVVVPHGVGHIQASVLGEGLAG